MAKFLALPCSTYYEAYHCDAFAAEASTSQVPTADSDEIVVLYETRGNTDETETGDHDDEKEQDDFSQRFWASFGWSFRASAESKRTKIQRHTVASQLHYDRLLLNIARVSLSLTCLRL